MMRSASAHAFASSRRRPNRAGSGEKAAQKFFLDSAAESMLGVPLRDRNRPNRTIGRFGRVASERRHQSQDGASLAPRGATHTLAIPRPSSHGRRAVRLPHLLRRTPRHRCRRSTIADDARRPSAAFEVAIAMAEGSDAISGTIDGRRRSTTRGAMLEQDAISGLALCSHLIDSGATLQGHARTAAGHAPPVSQVRAWT